MSRFHLSRVRQSSTGGPASKSAILAWFRPEDGTMKFPARVLFSIIVLAAFASAEKLAGNAPAGPTQSAMQPCTLPDQTPVSTPLASNTLITAQLSKSLDSRKNKLGDKVVAQTTMDILSHGQIVLPRETRILGHITAVQSRGSDSPKSMIGIAFDCLLMKSGRQFFWQASLQAVGPPMDPFAGYEGSQFSGSGNGRLSYSNSNDESKSPMQNYSGRTFVLASDPLGVLLDPPTRNSSAGPMGALQHSALTLKGISVSRSDQANLFRSSGKTIHLFSGTQLVFRTY